MRAARSAEGAAAQCGECPDFPRDIESDSLPPGGGDQLTDAECLAEIFGGSRKVSALCLKERKITQRNRIAAVLMRRAIQLLRMLKMPERGSAVTGLEGGNAVVGEKDCRAGIVAEAPIVSYCLFIILICLCVVAFYAIALCNVVVGTGNMDLILLLCGCVQLSEELDGLRE